MIVREHRIINNRHVVIEYFKDDDGVSFLRDVYSYLRKIFGVVLYFDRITDQKADLIYKGKQVAHLEYDDRTERITVTPYDKFYKPRWFYDLDNYDIKQYLADLILGDVES